LEKLVEYLIMDSINDANRVKKTTMKQPTLNRSGEFVIQVVPQSWLGRGLAAITGILLVVLALFFFFALFLVFGAVVLAALSVVLIRLIWGTWHTRARMSDEIIDGEYSVENRENVTKQPRSEKHG
jgi:membrane protein implicated in regulation of membrane protease activity